MTNVERFRAALAGEPVDRLPMTEWAPWWGQTLDRWHTEGLPPEMPSEDVSVHLGLDDMRQVRVNPLGPDCPAPSHHGAPRMTGQDYDAIRPFLHPPVDGLLQSMAPVIEAHERGETVMWLTVDGFFWFPRRLFGIQNHFYAFFDHPDLMHRMNQDLADRSIEIIRQMGEAFTPEFVTFAEDMSYNHGPMMSEAMFDEFIAPYYEQVVPVIEEIGSTLIVDSDGDVTEMVPWMERVGARGVLPLERQAGVDGMAIREAHPDFIMLGHYDKMVMNRGEAAIRGEFERLLPLMRAGRFIPSVDHQTPPGVSLEEYRIYMRLFAEYAHLGAQT